MSSDRANIRSGFTFLLLSFALAGSVYGQVVVGEAVDRETALPLQGVFVVLTDPAGRNVAGALTDERGRFRFRAPAPGRYSLRADRIGYETVYSAPLDLASGVTTYRFEIPTRPVDLTGLMVEGASRDCRLHPEEGVRIQNVWDQVRAALELAVWTERTGFLRMDRVRYERVLDPVSRRVRHEVLRPDGRTIGMAAFRALPAESLVTDGFVRPDGDGFMFYGLDAETVVSEAFQDAYCFGLRASDRGEDGLIGVTFVPLRGHRAPGVRGVLWVDRQSAELRRLEYTYTWIPWALPASPFGGDAEFRRLPDGGWIVDRWSIRMPQVRRIPVTVGDARRTTQEVLAQLRADAGLTIKEEVGEVAGIYRGAGLRLPRRDYAALQGTVRLGPDGQPLAGAHVALAGTDFEVTTDERGWYRLNQLPAGEYTVTIAHPALDRPGLEPATEVVTVVRGELTILHLVLPKEPREDGFGR